MQLILFGLLTALCSAAGISFKNPEEFETARKECVQEHNVSPELLAKYKSYEFPDDEVTHCYVRCILKKFDFFDDKEGFKTAALLSQLGHGKEIHDEVNSNVELCAVKNDAHADSCTWAYRGFQCFMDKHLPTVMKNMKKN